MSKLVLVPTPIGNLGDITYRAIEVLKEAPLVLAEDTRKSNLLLKHYHITKKLVSFHKYNEHKKLTRIVNQIKQLSSTALITDAGTPGISDPGFLLVRECVKEGIAIETLPGPTAFIPALINSGFPCDRFCFEGFLPQKKGRQKKLELLKEETRTMIFYESPFRLVKFLEQLKEAFGPEHMVSVSRELTKIYEETKRGSIIEVLEYFNNKEIKGEIVVVVKGTEE